eukprot:gene42905-52424_t
MQSQIRFWGVRDQEIVSVKKLFCARPKEYVPHMKVSRTFVVKSVPSEQATKFAMPRRCVHCNLTVAEDVVVGGFCGAGDGMGVHSFVEVQQTAATTSTSYDSRNVVPRNLLFSASALSANDGLAFIALPYGPGCYWSARSLITDLVAEVEHIQPEALPKVFNARRVDLPISYKTPPQGEEHYCRVTLDEICSAIAVGASLLTSQRVSVVQASQVGNKIDFFCASRRTSPEPVIMYEWNGFSVGLIANEAKSVDASLYECMCQAVQMASDCALTMLQFLQSDDIVVPYVTSAGFSVQFG